MKSSFDRESDDKQWTIMNVAGLSDQNRSWLFLDTALMFTVRPYSLCVYREIKSEREERTNEKEWG